jgi:hypothetical protein
MNDLLGYVDDGASNDEAGGNIPRCSALVKTIGVARAKEFALRQTRNSYCPET